MAKSKSFMACVMESPIGLSLSGIWLAFVGWRTATLWPKMSLDMAANDAATQAALDRATTAHLTNGGVLAFVGVLAILATTFVVSRLRGVDRKAVGGSVANWSGPRRILLMRHAEKTGDPADIHLSPYGQRRAEQLATFLPHTFGQPDALIAAARSRRSIRSIETLKPLAAKLGTTVRFDVEDDDFEDLVAELKTASGYRGKLVVIAWHHKKLAAISESLGAPAGTYPDPWPETLYGVIVDLDYAGGYPPTVKTVTHDMKR